MARRILLTTLAAGLLCAKPAAARVAVVATGTNDVALLDVVTDRVVARPALPGPSRAVAVSRDGRLGLYVISGGPGDDRINVVRGDHDTVRRGPGRDVVFADPADEVAADCEDVRR
jgi:hypothetical protein